MIAYLTLTQLDETLTGDLLERATMVQRQTAIERASADANGYLRAAGYTVPLALDDVPDELRGRIADVARYRLAVVLRLLPEPASTSALWIDYQAAVAWLKEMAAGRVTLDLPLATDAAEPGQPSISTNVGRRWDLGF